MPTELSFPFIPTWDECLNQHWRIHSRMLFEHPAISADQKSLWVWLASTQLNANEFNIKCSHSYEQISCAINQPCLVVHRLLFGLKIMGFIRARLPILFNELTIDIQLEIRKIELCMPSKVFRTTLDAMSEIKLGINLTAEPQEYNELTLV